MKVQLALSASYDDYADIIRQYQYPGTTAKEVRSSFLLSQLILTYRDTDPDPFSDEALLELDAKDSKVPKTIALSEKTAEKLNDLAGLRHKSTSEIARLLMLRAVTENGQIQKCPASKPDHEDIRLKLRVMHRELDRIAAEMKALYDALAREDNE